MNIALYSAEEVHAALPFARLADALAVAFFEGTEAPVRHAHQLSPEDTLLLMPAWRNDGTSPGALGIKVVTVMPGAAKKGASTVSALYLLLDRSTGKPLAILDGEALTFRRTAAASSPSTVPSSATPSSNWVPPLLASAANSAARLSALVASRLNGWRLSSPQASN